MTVTDKAPSQPVRDDPEALFPEARQRRRRIRITVGAILIVVAAIVAGIFYEIGGHGAPPTSPPPTSAKGQPNGAASPASGVGGSSAAETAACAPILTIKVPPGTGQPGSGVGVAIALSPGEVQNLIHSGDPRLAEDARTIADFKNPGGVDPAFMDAQAECRKLGVG